MQQAVPVAREYHGLLQFVFDWESGKFTMSAVEYALLPAIVLKARSAIEAKRRKIKEENDRKKRKHAR